MRLIVAAPPVLRGRESGTSLSFIASFNVILTDRRDYPPETTPCQARIARTLRLAQPTGKAMQSDSWHKSTYAIRAECGRMERVHSPGSGC